MVAASKEGAAGPGHVLAAKVAAAQWGAPAAMGLRSGGRCGGESEPGVERGEEGTGGLSTSTAGRGEGSGRAAEEEGAHSGMDATHQRRVRPLRHFTEHVSSSKVDQKRSLLYS